MIIVPWSVVVSGMVLAQAVRCQRKKLSNLQPTPPDPALAPDYRSFAPITVDQHIPSQTGSGFGGASPSQSSPGGGGGAGNTLRHALGHLPLSTATATATA